MTFIPIEIGLIAWFFSCYRIRCKSVSLIHSAGLVHQLILIDAHNRPSFHLARWHILYFSFACSQIHPTTEYLHCSMKTCFALVSKWIAKSWKHAKNSRTIRGLHRDVVISQQFMPVINFMHSYSSHRISYCWINK